MEAWRNSFGDEYLVVGERAYTRYAGDKDCDGKINDKRWKDITGRYFLQAKIDELSSSEANELNQQREKEQ